MNRLSGHYLKTKSVSGSKVKVVMVFKSGIKIMPHLMMSHCACESARNQGAKILKQQKGLLPTKLLGTVTQRRAIRRACSSQPTLPSANS